MYGSNLIINMVLCSSSSQASTVIPIFSGVGQVLGLTKQTVNSSVHKLERTGFVELRVEQGRGTHLHLTEAGRALVEERVRPVAEAETAAFVAMGSRDSEELLRLTHLHLELLREQVEALPYPDGR